MTAYVIVLPTTSQDHATLLAHPEVRALLSVHRARALAAPTAAPGQPSGAPAALTFAVPAMADATLLAAALRTHAGVDTAYAKPGEAAP